MDKTRLKRGGNVAFLSFVGSRRELWQMMMANVGAINWGMELFLGHSLGDRKAMKYLNGRDGF
jgi:hypothetical protein